MGKPNRILKYKSRKNTKLSYNATFYKDCLLFFVYVGLICFCFVMAYNSIFAYEQGWKDLIQRNQEILLHNEYVQYVEQY